MFRRLGRPESLSYCGAMAHEWCTHPRLRGRFHAENPDDLQVLVHDGGPRFTPNPPELVWVRVTGADGDVFSGCVLNAPVALEKTRQGDTIRFVVPIAGEYAIFLIEKYLRERSDWIIHPCAQCGLDELFDAPSDLVRAQFPDAPADATVEAFTVFCPLCGGVLVLEQKPGVLPT